ncbi:MAG: phosphate ABC transporter substrate-binding protein [Anaerotardibacter sp.]
MNIPKVAKVATGVVAAFALTLSLVGCSSTEKSTSEALSGTISTNGSTSMEKVIGSLSEDFMSKNSEVSITYDATGSGTGIECAKHGSADIGLSSRDLKEGEDGLETITVALDGIAVIVNEDCGVDDLSLQQVSDIFTGKITNWSEVGGNDLAISCVGRENGSGTRDGFETITGTTDKCVLEQELTSTGAVITAVASSKNAIGYASLSSVEGQSGIKALTINGVACSEETVLDGTYEIQRPFNFVLLKDAERSAQVQAFIDFATSADAADLIRKAGAVPLAK